MEAYRACRTASTNSSLCSSVTSQPAVWAGSACAAAVRCGTEPDRARAKVASAMPVIGTPRSSAFCTVHRPVPFCSARSSTTSTNAFPVSASTWESTSAVISIRNDSRSPSFQVRKIWPISAALAPVPCLIRSYASAISCMSAYSMPLCTILTKWPAPSGPT